MPGWRPRWRRRGWGCGPRCLTINCDTVGQMSCNPAIGGVAKGQIVREIDALGGAMGVLTDATAIQFRLLNRGKGPAMHSPRAQCDKKAYQFLAKLTVERQENLTLRQEMVESILVEGGRVVGVAVPRRRPIPRPGRRPHHRHVPPGPDAHRRGQDARRPRRRRGRGRDCRKACARWALSCGASRPARRRGSTAARSTSPGWSLSRAMPSRSRSRS